MTDNRKYLNVKSGNEVILLHQDKDMVTVQYVKNQKKVDYRVKYFEETFNPVTEVELP